MDGWCSAAAACSAAEMQACREQPTKLSLYAGSWAIPLASLAAVASSVEFTE